MHRGKLFVALWEHLGGQVHTLWVNAPEYLSSHRPGWRGMECWMRRRRTVLVEFGLHLFGIVPLWPNSRRLWSGFGRIPLPLCVTSGSFLSSVLGIFKGRPKGDTNLPLPLSMHTCVGRPKVRPTGFGSEKKDAQGSDSEDAPIFRLRPLSRSRSSNSRRDPRDRAGTLKIGPVTSNIGPEAKIGAEEKRRTSESEPRAPFFWHKSG